MNRSVFWRLVWKEYRVQRAFFVAIGAFAVAGELVVRWASGLEGEALLVWIFGVGLGLAAFYGLGVGATLFAAEHETGTYDFQRSLPVRAGTILGAKTAFALASTAAMLLAAWAGAWAIAGGQLPEPKQHAQLWGLWGVAALEMLMWGMLFSLRLRQPLVAVIVAVTCASTCTHVLAGPSPGRLELASYLAAVPARLMVVMLVAAVCTVLGLRWLQEPGRASGRRGWRPARAPSSAVRQGPTVFAMVGRLLWQQARQSAGLMGALGAMTVAGVFVLRHGPLWPVPRAAGGYLLAVLETSQVMGILVMLLIAPLAGATVFFTDQSGYAFRFLAERGVRPRLVWFGRHLLWGTLVAIGAALVVGLIVFPVPASPQSQSLAATMAGFVALAYACGQLGSMWCHSAVLAAVAGVGLTLALCGWAAAAAFLNLHWLWSVAPLPAAFLLTTWLWSPAWLLERPGWRSRVLASVPIAVALAGILMAIPVVRVHQIPRVDPGIHAEALTAPPSPEAQATVALYQQALKALRVSPAGAGAESPTPDRLTEREAAFLRDNQNALALTLQACQRKEADFRTGAALPAGAPFAPFPLVHLLFTQAKKLELEGRFAAALEHYLAALRMTVHLRCGTVDYWLPDSLEREVWQRVLDWAVRPGQSSQYVLQAVRRIPEVLADAPPPSEALAREYLRNLRILQGDPAILAAVQLDPHSAWKPGTLHLDPHTAWQLSVLGRWFPWERTRAIHFLRWCAAKDLERVRAAERRLAEGQPVLQDNEQFIYFDGDEWQLARSTIGNNLRPARRYLAIEGVVLPETRRRATLIRLALVAWRLEHGQLPDKLDRLAGVYFERVPSDPFTGQPFEYFPKGLPYELRWSEPRSNAEQRLAGGTPFLWSAGLRVRLASAMATVASRWRLADGRWSWPASTVEQAIWQAGWVFPIPLAR